MYGWDLLYFLVKMDIDVIPFRIQHGNQSLKNLEFIVGYYQKSMPHVPILLFCQSLFRS